MNRNINSNYSENKLRFFVKFLYGFLTHFKLFSPVHCVTQNKNIENFKLITIIERKWLEGYCSTTPNFMINFHI